MIYRKLISTGLLSGALLISPFSGFGQSGSDTGTNAGPNPTKSFAQSKKSKDLRMDPADAELKNTSNALSENPAPNPGQSGSSRVQREAQPHVSSDAVIAVEEDEVLESEINSVDEVASIHERDEAVTYDSDLDQDYAAEVEATDRLANDALAENPVPNPEKRSMNATRRVGEKPVNKAYGTAEADLADAHVDAEATQPELGAETTREGLAASTADEDLAEEVGESFGPSTITVINAGDTLGWDVVDASGNKLGDLSDYAIRPEEQEIAFLIVKAGGLLGMGGQDHFLELSQVERVNDEHEMVFDLTEEEFDQLANIDATQRDGLIRFFSDLEGEQAVSDDGTELGSIQDMLVRFDGGNVAHVIINPNTAFVTQWGYGFRVAVPASEVIELKDNDELVLGVDRNDVLTAELAENMDDVRLLETESADVYRLDLTRGTTAARD